MRSRSSAISERQIEKLDAAADHVNDGAYAARAKLAEHDLARRPGEKGDQPIKTLPEKRCGARSREATKTDEMIALANTAVEEAERWRLESRETIAKDPDRLAEPSGQPSGCLVVTLERVLVSQVSSSIRGVTSARLHRKRTQGGSDGRPGRKPNSPLKVENHVGFSSPSASQEDIA
jgi:hypothetical protein